MDGRTVGWMDGLMVETVLVDVAVWKNGWMNEL